MAEQAAKLKEKASQLPGGKEGDDLLRQARMAETGSHFSE